MAFRAIIGLLASLLIGTAALAEDVVLNPSHPQRYTVVRGDTLWDIAGRFLRDPWMWPKVWKGNPHIDNPHLIYPGDKIVLTYVGGVPQLGLSGDSLRSRDVRLSPQIRITPIEEAVPVIPIKMIAPFLTSPRITTDQEMARAPYVVEFAGEHLVAAGGDRIYARSIPTPGISAFTVYRPGNIYKDPETQEVLGYQAIYIADTQLDRVGDPATLTVTKAAGEIRRGDRLLPNTEGQISLQYRPHAPDKPISGHIIDVLEGVSQIGQYNVVVLNRGLRDGVEMGHVFDIFRSGRVVRDDFGGKPNMTVQLPDEEAGRLMVFRTFERVSFALVMDASSAINLFDKVKTP